MTRKIKVVTLNGVSGIIETNATTLGELKPILRSKSIDYSGMKLLVGETKNELSEDVAILPEGDFKLYITPSKTKSGGVEGDLQIINQNILKIFNLLSSNFKEKSISAEDVADLKDIRKFANGYEVDAYEEDEDDNF